MLVARKTSDWFYLFYKTIRGGLDVRLVTAIQIVPNKAQAPRILIDLLWVRFLFTGGQVTHTHKLWATMNTHALTQCSGKDPQISAKLHSQNKTFNCSTPLAHVWVWHVILSTLVVLSHCYSTSTKSTYNSYGPQCMTMLPPQLTFQCAEEGP